MTSNGKKDITLLLEAWRHGDQAAGEELMRLVYAELRKIAGGYLAVERQGHTLEPTAVVNEAYLRLADQTSMRWQDRSHFFAIAAKMIRRVLVDHARRHRSAKRGGGAEKIPLAEIPDLALQRPDKLVDLDNALTRLKGLDPLQAAIVEYRFFGGLTGHEIAEVVGRSAATVQRNWQLAKAWLYRELSRGPVSRP